MTHRSVHRFFGTASHEARRWPRWVSERWKVKYYQCAHRREESQRVVNTREDEAFPDHTSLAYPRPLRLSWSRLPTICYDESRPRMRRCFTDRPDARVYWSHCSGSQAHTEGSA